MLTIIIPTKNRAKYLDYLMPILLSDDCPADKILIGNDGSTDNTQEIINRYITSKKLSAITNPKSIGALATNCKLFQQIETKYFMFMSDDDYIDNKLIKKLLSGIILSDSALGFGKYRIDNMGNIQDIIHPGWVERINYQSDFLTSFAHDHYMFTAATIFKTSLLPQNRSNEGVVPFDINLNDFVKFDNLGEFRALDWDLALNMTLQFPNRIFYLDEYVATFRKVDGQLSSDENYQFSGRSAMEMAILILKYFSNYEIRTLFQQNPIILKSVSNLLSHKINQIKSDKKELALAGYMPMIKAAKTLLESLVA